MMNDRLKGAMQSFTRSASPEMDYRALYECRVTGQNADGTLELTPLSDTISTHSNVPILYESPGVKITVQPGVYVLLGWKNGDPSKKYAALFPFGASGDLQSKVVTAAQKLSFVAPAVNLGQDPGAAAVGRVGDQVQVTIPAGAVIIAASGGTPNPAPITLTGTITTGASITKAS